MKVVLSITRRAAHGFSLVELMVAMTLSLVLLAGVVAIFISSRNTYETTDQLSRVQESGRFALDMIVRDLRGAGFVGCNKRADVLSSLRTPNSILWNFSRAIEGFDGVGASWSPTLDTTIITSANAAGDVIAIRAPRGDYEPLRLLDRMTTDADPMEVDATIVSKIDLKPGDIVQVSDCTSRGIIQVTDAAGGVLAHEDQAANASGITDKSSPGNLSGSAGAAFGVNGEVVAMNSVVYFLRASGSGSGLALWRRVASANAAEEVVEGVESMQFAYGEDTNNDAVISVNEYRTATNVANWANVLSVRVALLVRSTSQYGTDRDSRTYSVLEKNIAAPNDRRLRQVFSTTVAVRNSAI
jgi:type IV pilus assembly protein PilW